MNCFLKNCAPLLLALPLALSTPARSQPDVAIKTQDEAYKTVQTLLRANKYAEAAAEAERVLQTPGLSANDKVRFLKAAADARLRRTPPDAAGATALYEKIVADAALPNAAKIEALSNIANAYITTLAGQNLDEMDLSPAHAALGRALKLENLQPEERAVALKNIGKLYRREDKEDAARASYQQILALDVSERTRADAQRAIADTYLGEGRNDEALALYQQQGWSLEPIYRRLGDTEKVTAESLKVLNDPQAAENTRWITFTRLPLWDARPKSISEMQKVWDTFMPAFLEKDPNRPLFLLRAVMNDSAEPNFVAWAVPLLLPAPKLSDKDYQTLKVKLLDALAAQGQTAAMMQQAQALSTDARVDAATHFWAQLVAASAKPDAAAKIVQNEKALPAKEKADALLRAAQTALRAGDATAARRLYDLYEASFAAPPHAEITCAFVPDAPFDVGSWLTSPLLKNAAAKGKINRPYGDNLQFLLETDSAVSGRKTSTQASGDTGDTDTDFYVACDDKGLHFFFYAYDSKVQEVLNGLTGGGSFEMYLAPGEHQAYYTFLPEVPDGRIDPKAFLSMYPNAQFRIPSLADGTLRSEGRTTDKGYAMYFFLSWETFYDKLPRNGDKWQFEAFRWTRSGGFSFGGSQSVHNRSSFGDIVFSGLTPDRLNAIKRAIIFKAVAKYRAAKGITQPVGNWADPETGDPAFYRSQVEPLLKTLDAYAGQVGNDMTAAQVEALFRDAVPGWMEIEYRVAALRAHYLKAKLVQGARP